MAHASSRTTRDGRRLAGAPVRPTRRASGRRRWGIAIAVLAVLPGASQAQLTGRVMDSAGRPVVSAAVELLAGDSVLARTTADELGHFDLPPHGRAERVRAERFGFEPRSVPLGDLLRPIEIEIELVARPIELAGLQVEAAVEGCPDTSSESARLVLAGALADRPLFDDDTYWSAPILELRTGEGAAEGGVGFSEARFFAEEPSDLRLFMSKFSQPEELARPSNSRDASGGRWQLLSLHGSAVFELYRRVEHRNARIDASAHGSRLSLCLPDDGAHLRATFVLADARLETVHWTVTSPDREESRGGTLQFERGGLLPSRSYTWSRNASHSIAHAYAIFGDWLTGDRDDVARAVRGR